MKEDLIKKYTTESALTREQIETSIFIKELRKHYSEEESLDRAAYAADTGLFRYLEAFWRNYNNMK